MLYRRLMLVFAVLLTAVSAQTDRVTLPLNGAWFWHLGGDEAEARAGGAGWQRVSVPHSWNAEDCTSPSMLRGKGWYRRKFAVLSLKPGQRAYLNFEGVSQTATVWLNGEKVASHDNGFARFRVDVTRQLREDQDNELLVLADSTWRDDVPPREGDFALCGGIYRDVFMIITRDAGFDLLDHGGPGVRITTPQVSKSSSTVRAVARLRNQRKAPLQATLRVTLLDAQGASVAETTSQVTLAPGVVEVPASLAVDQPRLWQGRKDPYLYRARLRLEERDAILDQTTVTFGIRTVAVSATEGFLLNGIPYELRGANLHQDRAGKGWTGNDADRAEDLRLITEMGATFVRLVHYQHDEDIYDQADRLGLVLWAEHALVNTISPTEPFTQRCEEQVRELISQGFNHPSIACWGVGNEVQPDKPGAPALLTRLGQVAKGEDPSRFTVLATCFGEPFGSYHLDTLAHNKYHGWYHDRAEDFGGWLEAQLAKGGPIGMSEYGAGAGINTHSAQPRPMDHSEEYQAIYHEVYWKILRQHPEVWCKAVWQMFDAASPTRKEGETVGVNDKGLVTRDRKTPKDAYYFYQANWTTALMVHIASTRFVERTEAATDLKAYSNGDYVEAFQNGRSLGRRRPSDGIALWPGLVLTPGANEITLVAHRGADTATKTCTWNLKPSKTP